MRGVSHGSQGRLNQQKAGLRAIAPLPGIANRPGWPAPSNLGTVELAIALHNVFDTPRDRIVWDVGHQSYPHKILTGRREAMATLRQQGGLSGFPRRCESEYDAFGTAHSSTSISAALGMAVAAPGAVKSGHDQPGPPRPAGTGPARGDRPAAAGGGLEQVVEERPVAE